MRSRRIGQPDASSVVTKLSRAEKQSIQNAYEKLAGRAIAFTECPIPRAKMVGVWNGFENKEALGATLTLKRLGESVSRYIVHDATLGEGAPWPWTINIRNYDFKDEGFEPLYNFAAARDDEPTYESFVAAMGDDYDTFVEWAKRAHNIHLEYSKGKTTLENVLKMCSTVGQVHRVAADLIHLMSPGVQQALSEMKVRSPLPADYFELNHDDVKELGLFISKCALLPPLPNGRHDDARIIHYMTWATHLNPDGTPSRVKCSD